MPLKCETNLLQDLKEFDQFLKFIRKHNVKSYLEIGSKHGGSFWRISTSLPKGSRVVSVDLPHGDTSFKESEPNLKACVEELKRRGYDAHLILGDSTEPEIVEKARSLGPYDLVFIDANHTEAYVRKDWDNYKICSNIIAFHDIGWRARPAPSKKMPIEVPIVWAELKQLYRNVEIRCCVQDNGIGILWMDQPAA